MAIKSLFVIFLFSLFVVSCVQMRKMNFKNIDSQRIDLKGFKTKDLQKLKLEENINFETRVSGKLFRPKVSLVLGPGASRSFAHIGVLKELKALGIQIHSIVGMGWSAIIAAEYVDQKSVHGLEWKASRSTEFKKLLETSFWSSTIKEKTLSEAENLVKSLLTDYSIRGKNRGEFSCPLLSKSKNTLVLSDKRGLKNCIAVPPLFNPGKNYAPYLFDILAIQEGVVRMGAEKVIFIDVLNKNKKFFGKKEAFVSGAVYWYWAFASEMTQSAYSVFDKVIEIDVDSEILNFNNTLDSVRKGRISGRELAEFLQKEYQY